jgi:hypothetical protein
MLVLTEAVTITVAAPEERFHQRDELCHLNCQDLCGVEHSRSVLPSLLERKHCRHHAPFLKHPSSPEVVISLAPLTEEPQIFQGWRKQLHDLGDLPQVVTDELAQAHYRCIVQELHWDLAD